jgi:predicted nucleic-acid-binding protein
MTGLDTNILIRYMLRDDPGQSPRAEKLMEQLTESDPGFISVVVVVETAWVLEHVYKFADHEIAAAIERMLQIDVLVVEHRLEVYLAIAALKQRQGHFADALIGAISRRAGCRRILTFDRKASRLPGFKLLQTEQ